MKSEKSQSVKRSEVARTFGLTGIPRIDSLQAIKDAAIVARGHLHTQCCRYKSEVKQTEVLLAIPWDMVVFEKLGYLRSLRDFLGCGGGRHLVIICVLKMEAGEEQ